MHCSKCGYDGQIISHDDMGCQMLERLTNIEEHAESTDEQMGSLVHSLQGAFLREKQALRAACNPVGMPDVSQNLLKKNLTNFAAASSPTPSEHDFGAELHFKRVESSLPDSYLRIRLCQKCGVSVAIGFLREHRNRCK